MIFELKDEHLKLLEKLNLQRAGEGKFDSALGWVWVSDDEYEKLIAEGTYMLFGVYHLLTGKSPIDFQKCSDKEIDEYGKLLLEMTVSMRIIFQTRSFKLGKYKRYMNTEVWSFIGE